MPLQASYYQLVHLITAALIRIRVTAALNLITRSHLHNPILRMPHTGTSLKRYANR